MTQWSSGAQETHMPVNLTPEAANAAADWLERRCFVAHAVPGASDHDAHIALEAWTAGFRRSVSELRGFADLHTPIPDDVSELDR